MSTKTASRGNWRIEWSGGRLAEICWGNDAVDCIQVVDYDWQTGKAGPLRQPLGLQLARWIREHGAEYTENVVQYLR